MHEFDPRRPAFRIAPRALMGVAGAVALMLGLKLSDAQANIPGPALRAQDAARISALQHAAFAASEAQPGLYPAQPVDIRIQSGETFEAALRRSGVSPADAKAAAALVEQSQEPIRIQPG